MADFPHYDLRRFATDPASAAEVDAICRDTGFLVLTGHGVATDVITGVWQAAQAFFAAACAQGLAMQDDSTLWRWLADAG